MEMTAHEALKLVRRQRRLPRTQARQMRSLLRTTTVDSEVFPQSLAPLCELIWLAQVTPESRRRH